MSRPSLLTAALLAWGISPAAPAHALQAPELGAVESQYDFKFNTGTAVKSARGWVVGTMLSRQGQSKEDFVADVGRYLDAWTKQSGAEACAKLAQDDQSGQWGVMIVTQRSQISCIQGASMLPPFMKPTGESIHSHPHVQGAHGYVSVSRETARLAELLGSKLKVGQKLRLPEPEHFSPADIASGKGYLVTGGRLKFQDGVGTEQDLGQVEASVAMTP